MPRYHFTSINGRRDTDDDGIDLPNDATAQRMAAQFAAEVMGSDPNQLWDEGQWRIEVSDEEGALLFSVVTFAINASRPNAVVYV